MLAEIRFAGCYFPRARLSAEAIRAAGLSVPRGFGSKPVCAPDEDALTMAIAAVAQAVGRKHGDPIASPAALALASTSLPYERRVQAALLAEAQGWRSSVTVTEHTTSARASVEAVLAVLGVWATDTAGSEEGIVVASHLPSGSAESSGEPVAGAGATALVLARPRSSRSPGAPPSLASIDAIASHAAEDPGLQFVTSGSSLARDVQVGGYAEATRHGAMTGAAEVALRRAGLVPRDLAFAALGTLDSRATAKLAAALGLAGSQWRENQPFERLGDQGANGPVVSLLAGLDRASPGDRGLWMAYGAGSAADAIVVTAGPDSGHGIVDEALSGGRDIDYLEYLRARGAA